MQFSVSPTGLLTMTQDGWRWTLQGLPIDGPTQPPQPPTQPPTQPPAGRIWDSRLDRRGVTLRPAQTQPGQTYWRLVRAEYRDRNQAQGKHHIYADVLDGSGRRLVGMTLIAGWDGGQAAFVSEAKPGEDAAANFPMFAAGWGYRVRMDGLSDEVAGMGLGDIGSEHMAEHVSYLLVFQRVTA